MVKLRSRSWILVRRALWLLNKKCCSLALRLTFELVRLRKDEDGKAITLEAGVLIESVSSPFVRALELNHMPELLTLLLDDDDDMESLLSGSCHARWSCPPEVLYEMLLRRAIDDGVAVETISTVKSGRLVLLE
jgi:hypothetical protein